MGVDVHLKSCCSQGLGRSEAQPYNFVQQVSCSNTSVKHFLHTPMISVVPRIFSNAL